MSTASALRGGAPVGFLEELDQIEAAAICYLRLWSDGPDARARLYEDLFAGLGQTHGDHARAAFEEMSSLLAHFGRRPLMRHAVGCRCLGSDEACFANLVGAAANGDRGDATLIATLLVRPDVSPMLAAATSQFGLALKRMALKRTGLVSARAFIKPSEAPPPREMMH